MHLDFVRAPYFCACILVYDNILFPSRFSAYLLFLLTILAVYMHVLVLAVNVMCVYRTPTCVLWHTFIDDLAMLKILKPHRHFVSLPCRQIHADRYNHTSILYSYNNLVEVYIFLTSQFSMYSLFLSGFIFCNFQLRNILWLA